jgi:hypothetical protein
MREQRVEPKDDSSVTGQTARRRFLKKSGQVAVAAPAAVLLLSATRANAIQPDPYLGPG